MTKWKWIPHDPSPEMEQAVCEAINHDLPTIEVCRAMIDAAPNANPPVLLACHRRECERAIDSALHPKGMSVHDGKARIDANILQRLLLITDLIQRPPELK